MNSADDDHNALLANLRARSAAELEQLRHQIVEDIQQVFMGPGSHIHRRTAEAANKILHRMLPDAQAVRLSAADIKTIFGLTPSQIAKLITFYQQQTGRKAEDI